MLIIQETKCNNIITLNNGAKKNHCHYSQLLNETTETVPFYIENNQLIHFCKKTVNLDDKDVVNHINNQKLKYNEELDKPECGYILKCFPSKQNKENYIETTLSNHLKN